MMLSFVTLFTEVCPVHGEEDPLVCLLGWPGDPIISRTGHWSAYLPPLSGEHAYVSWENVNSRCLTRLGCSFIK